MKCRRCKTPLTANTLSHCPVCGPDRERVEQRNILRLSLLPIVASALLTIGTIALVAALLLCAACGSNTVQNTKEKAEQQVRELADRGGQWGKDVYDKGRELGKSSLDELRDYGRDILREHGDDINAAGAKINELLDRIARDPNDEASTADKVARMIVLMLPLVGPTKRYGDARRLYEVGAMENDQGKMQEARRECLVACAEAGLDIGTLGLVGAKVDLVTTGADQVLTALKLTRNVNVLIGNDLKVFDDFVDQVLEQEEIRAGIDTALTADFSQVVDPRAAGI